MFIPDTRFRHIARVVVTQGKGFLQQPIRETAVAALAVRPRANADHHIQPGPLTFLNEKPYVAVAGEIKFTLDLLVVDPEQIGGNRADSAGLHLAEFRIPMITPIPDKVVFSHDADKGLAVSLKIQAVDRERFSRGADAAHGQMTAQDLTGLVVLKTVYHSDSSQTVIDRVFVLFACRASGGKNDETQIV